MQRKAQIELQAARGVYPAPQKGTFACRRPQWVRASPRSHPESQSRGACWWVSGRRWSTAEALSGLISAEESRNSAVVSHVPCGTSAAMNIRINEPGADSTCRPVQEHGRKLNCRLRAMRICAARVPLPPPGRRRRCTSSRCRIPPQASAPTTQQPGRQHGFTHTVGAMVEGRLQLAPQRRGSWGRAAAQHRCARRQRARQLPMLHQQQALRRQRRQRVSVGSSAAA